MNNDVNHHKNIVVREELPSTLYHYTSIATFYNIITNGQIWLGNTANMNDEEEVRYFLKKLEKALKNAIRSEYKDRCKEFFHDVYERLNGEYPYAMSFSILKDNAAQWERYGDNAQGICIGFNTEKLKEFFACPYSPIHRVFYDGDIREHDHFKILETYFNTGKLTYGFDTGHKKKDIKAYVDSLLANAYMIKNPSFVSECEVRIVILWNHIFEESEIKSELINNQIKSFMEINYKKVCKNKNIQFEDMIDEIMLGPRKKQSIYEMQKFLRENSYNQLAECVIESKSSLR